jgi:ABC-type phosphate transport system auxiliary subunit
MKTLSRDEVQRRKDQAVKFTRDVRDDPERAAEIEDESLEDYAERKKIQIQIQNPRRIRYMASKRELEERIQELEDENDDLNDRLDQVADLAGVEEEEEEEEQESRPNRR